MATDETTAPHEMRECRVCRQVRPIRTSRIRYGDRRCDECAREEARRWWAARSPEQRERRNEGRRERRASRTPEQREEEAARDRAGRRPRACARCGRDWVTRVAVPA